MPVFKRYSTYANLVAMIVSAGLVSIGNIGLQAETVAYIMMGGNIVVAVCQFIKQQENVK